MHLISKHTALVKSHCCIVRNMTATDLQTDRTQANLVPLTQRVHEGEAILLVLHFKNVCCTSDCKWEKHLKSHQCINFLY